MQSVCVLVLLFPDRLKNFVLENVFHPGVIFILFNPNTPTFSENPKIKL